MARDTYGKHAEGGIYKIWDKKGEYYLSANSKSTWRSLHWVAARLLDMKKWNPEGFNPDDYEIHEFEVVHKGNLDVLSILDKEEGRRNKKKYAKKRMEELKPALMTHLPGVSEFYVAKRLYNSGMLKESVMARIEEMMKEYLECEKIAG